LIDYCVEVFSQKVPFFYQLLCCRSNQREIVLTIPVAPPDLLGRERQATADQVPYFDGDTGPGALRIPPERHLEWHRYSGEPNPGQFVPVPVERGDQAGSRRSGNERREHAHTLISLRSKVDGRQT
jgi:hypothetical protein